MNTINERGRGRTDRKTREGRCVMLINGFALFPLSLYSTSCRLQHTQIHTLSEAAFFMSHEWRRNRKKKHQQDVCAAREKPPPATQACLLVVYCSHTHTRAHTYAHALLHARWSVIFRHAPVSANERPGQGSSERDGEGTECCRLIDSQRPTGGEKNGGTG